MSFIYYFPKRETPPSKNKFIDADKEQGLDVVLRDASLANTYLHRGPDQDAGYLAMIDRPEFGAINLAFDPDKQVWIKASDHYWLGWWKDKKPPPELLKRPKTVDGEWIELDDHDWLVPVCGPLRTTLPVAFTMTLDGEWDSEPVEEYRALMKDCEQAMADSEDATKPNANFKTIFKRHMLFCCRLLSVNYHVGPREVSELKILRQDTFGKILNIAWGVTTVERELEAKKAEGALVAAP